MAAAAKQPYPRLGEAAWNTTEKVNAELLTMTYGAMVTQLLKDYKDVKVVNTELEKMGYNIGIRLIDEFLAKSGTKPCANFKETAQVIAKVAFKMFLGITAEVVSPSAVAVSTGTPAVSRGATVPAGTSTNSAVDDSKQFSLTFKGNPFFDFVELPATLTDLQYGNILCGVIRGALQMIQLVVDCQYVRSELTGASESEIRVTLKEILQETPVEEDD